MRESAYAACLRSDQAYYGSHVRLRDVGMAVNGPHLQTEGLEICCPCTRL